MKAVVLYGEGDVRIDEVPEPIVEPGGVVVRVRASGICGSDLHGYRHGSRGKMRLGHEFSGDIVEIGEGVTGVKIGDRVTAIGGKGCGECYWCKKGDYIRCRQLGFLGYAIPGALAEYVAVPSFVLGQYADKLPDNISYEEGATVEPIAVSLYAVQQVQPEPNDTVVVIGLGILGLCIIAILKSMGVRQIIASGRREQRLRLARDFGADIVIDAARDDIVPLVNELNDHKGADIVFDCAGKTETFQQSLDIIRRGGKVDLVGLYQEEITFRLTFLVGNDVSLIGCGLRWDLPGALKLLINGTVDAKPLVTHQFPIDKAKEAFDAALSAPDAVKVIINP
jgi:2-desacetyl-2-hydroxyethyl bacteriochlorophyllide A dehydrogenase